MTREELIRQCRFYKGEEECPYPDDMYYDTINRIYYWWTEKDWVFHKGMFFWCWNGEDPLDRNVSDWGEYMDHGGKKFLGIPDSLLSFFWHGFLKAANGYGYDIEDFYKRINNYLNTSKE